MQQYIITIHFYRQYVCVLSESLLPPVKLMCNSAVIDGKSFGEFSKEYFNALIQISLIMGVDAYVKERIVNTKKPAIKMDLTAAEALVLLKCLMTLPLEADKDNYINHVRQLFIAELHQNILSFQPDFSGK